MISMIKNSLMEILEKHIPTNNIKQGDFEHWEEVTEDKSALIEWLDTETIARTITQKASLINLNIYYIGIVPVDKNKENYITDLNLLFKELSESKNLNKVMTSMKIKAGKVERRSSNNNNYITKINITGQLPL